MECEVPGHEVTLLTEFKRNFERIRGRTKAMMQVHAVHEKFSVVTSEELTFNR
jgi:hypothetical protein